MVSPPDLNSNVFRLIYAKLLEFKILIGFGLEVSCQALKNVTVPGCGNSLRPVGKTEIKSGAIQTIPLSAGACQVATKQSKKKIHR